MTDQPAVRKWPPLWAVQVWVRYRDPGTGRILKVTVETDIDLDMPQVTNTVGEARHAVKLAAVELFKNLDLPSLVTDRALYAGDDPDIRMSISASPGKTI